MAGYWRCIRIVTRKKEGVEAGKRTEQATGVEKGRLE